MAVNELKGYIQIFFTAWAQIGLVVLNTWQIANSKYIGSLVVSFLISLFWTFNVRSVAGGTWSQRLTYCVGGTVGTATGLLLSLILYKG